MKGNENHEEKLAQRRAHYEREDINGKLVINLRDIGHAIRGLYEGRGSQKRVLMVLNEIGTVTQRDLTQQLGIQPGSASEVIAKLENAGLLTRTESETDRRTVNVALTEEGQKQAEEAKSQRIERHETMFTTLTGEEKTQLLSLLEKINSDWEVRFADHQDHDCHHGQGEHHHDHSKDHHGRHGGKFEAHQETESHEGGIHLQREGKHGCNHDCANCPHPCPKGRSKPEGGR